MQEPPTQQSQQPPGQQIQQPPAQQAQPAPYHEPQQSRRQIAIKSDVSEEEEPDSEEAPVDEA
ncbi:hypothetical protein [Haloarcula salinisoli]|uniref:Uncharacterized protein n=1 Tax=Haloarcula salinisoli TaxID=2487746 RepID=A0A8J7YHY7_9EURY|nr:hypothetical protein [Halomicroarcula salinisoli]MBX0305887.1 hypothetical protein [Halomicroarcula salinisoli]